MSYASEFTAIAGLFSTGWGSTTPIAWPNVAFTPTTDVSWVRFAVLSGESKQMSCGSPGSNVIRHVGRVVIQVFVPTTKGEVVARTLADSAAAIFRGDPLAGTIRFDPPYVGGVSSVYGQIGYSLADGWYQTNVNIPFQRDEIL